MNTEEYVRANLILDNIHSSLHELIIEKGQLVEALRRVELMIKNHIDFINKLDNEIN